MLSPQNQVDRRDFLKLSGAGLAAALMSSKASAETSPVSKISAERQADTRPNILFIWTDQLTRSAMSHAGNIHLNTPAIDSLAREGVTFDCAYTSNPLCVPARTSWITAQMPHKTTVTFNSPKHTIAVAPVSRLMKEAGYDTGYSGKWHIPHPAEDTAWHGFDFIRHAKANKTDPFVAGDSIEFITKPRNKPFFLVSSFVDPHDICEWARMQSGIKDDFKNGSIPAPPPPEQCPPLPANFAIPEGEPEVIRQLQAGSIPTYPTVRWPEANWRQYLWAYYRLIEKVDARIGEILKALKDSGQDENTVIIFSSDHGDGGGSHRWNQKTIFYEEIVGVPVIVRPPKCAHAGTRDKSNLVCMNTDFFPTVFDYAGIQKPEGLPGQSVRPLVERKANAKGHAYVVSQNDLAPISGRSGKVYGRMLRTSRYKYIRFSKGAHKEQLFDEMLDPGELNDLSISNTHLEVLQNHRKILDTWLLNEKDPFPNAVCEEDLHPGPLPTAGD